MASSGAEGCYSLHSSSRFSYMCARMSGHQDRDALYGRTPCIAAVSLHLQWTAVIAPLQRLHLDLQAWRS